MLAPNVTLLKFMDCVLDFQTRIYFHTDYGISLLIIGSVNNFLTEANKQIIQRAGGKSNLLMLAIEYGS